MARSKTGSFWLTEKLEVSVTATPVQGTIDLGAYVDVGDQQALAIEEVDFIWQGSDGSGNARPGLGQSWGADGVIAGQLLDLNPGTTLQVADEHSLIASGATYFDSANIATTGSDFFPDSFGKLDESRMVVNDQLYFVAEAICGTFTAPILATVRIKCRIVKLGTKDWMAIAIQSTAADN